MADLRNPHAAALYESIRARLGADEAEAVFANLTLSKTPAEKQKLAWARASCEALDSRYDEETAVEIRKGCSCRPPRSKMALARRLFEQSDSLEDFARRYGEAFDDNALEARGGALLLIYPQCCCPLVKRAQTTLPKTWCACSLGYAETLFSYALSREVKAELLSSVLLGGSRCEIRITPADGAAACR